MPRRCTLCDTLKPDKQFGFRRTVLASGEVKLVQKTFCLECDAGRSKRYRDTHQSKVRAMDAERYAHGSKREGHLRRKYGMTSAEFEAMAVKQHGKCKVCREPPSAGRWSRKYRLHVDHDHTSGRVRGLVCYRCNMAIGFLRDSPKLARSVAKYLEK